ncbi:EboA domain-containing protein [Actinoallomurus soli]|uniref:EboA domain-containing protein n=1 Tax=Actinoallomurus soli TaxID=2952535 RepID=UPI0020933323|nr:EboA domain-containing protein [Actinoallomurus soli]
MPGRGTDGAPGAGTDGGAGAGTDGGAAGVPGGAPRDGAGGATDGAGADEVWSRIGAAGRAWLRGACAAVADRPERVRELFPAAGRHCGRAPLCPGDPEGLVHGRIDDAARGVLLGALPMTGAALAAEVTALYRCGDAAERRGVLRGLPRLDEPDRPDGVGDRLVPVVREALRCDDVRLVVAALGPYARRLDDAAWRDGVLKCLFTGVPLAAVAGLGERADAELARMFADFARERVAAGRDVPADTWLVLDRFPGAPAGSGPSAEPPAGSAPSAEPSAADPRPLGLADPAQADAGRGTVRPSRVRPEA